MITENVSTLKIHKLTQEQYDRESESGTLEENAIYLTPQEAIDLSNYATVESLNQGLKNKVEDSGGESFYQTLFFPIFKDSMSMDRKPNTEVGMKSIALGYYSEASGMNSQAFGFYSTASNTGSQAFGTGCQSTGEYSQAFGAHTIASGDYSHAEGYRTEALAHQHAQGHHNDTSVATAGFGSGALGGDNNITEGTAFVIGNGTFDSPSNAFRVTYSGIPYAKSSLTTTGADYAEYFEWQDLNPNAEDRRGYFVTLDGDKIKIAQPDDYILGVVSGQPSVIGNGDEDWMGRYVFDEFGAFVYEDFEYEMETFEGITNEETGEIILEPKTIKKTGKKYKENPDYDPSLAYVQREDRPEWNAVGMIGVLSVRDDGSCQVNGFCEVAEGGIATASESGYRVISRVSDNVIKIILK